MCYYGHGVIGMTFGDKIKKLRLMKGMTLEQVGDIVGVGKSTVRKWECGQIANMRRDKIAKLAGALGVSPSYLMGWEEGTVLLDGDSAVSMAVKRVPIIGETAAGRPIVANRIYDEYIDVPMAGRKFDAAVRVTGDSMEPEYRIGDLALIRYQDDVLDGQIAVVCLDDEVTLKRLYHLPNGVMLQSTNPKYPPMMIGADDVDCIHLTGRAVGVIHWED